MLVGYNHNIRYRGDVFHVQTEDSGISNPHIITLLYRGGTILASKKTSYADILKIENLEQVVEELMKDQHKEMLRRLKAGEFDSRAFPGLPPPAPRAPTAEEAPSSVPEPPAATASPPTPAAPAAPPRRAEVVPQEGRAATLDQIILDYLITDDTGR
jgi:hypothetical protein